MDNYRLKIKNIRKLKNMSVIKLANKIGIKKALVNGCTP